MANYGIINLGMLEYGPHLPREIIRREVRWLKTSDVIQLVIALLLGLTLVVSIVNLAVK